jgi:hypothetical protein
MSIAQNNPMQRTPVIEPLPLPCFGSEHEAHDPMCQTCPHQGGCIKATGKRGGYIRLSKAEFNPIPTKLENVIVVDPDASNLQSLYERCHWAVYECPPSDAITRWPNAVEKLVAISEELDCSLQIVITSMMIAMQQSNPDRPFFANMLLGRSVVKNVGMFRDVCRSKYGFFDISTMNSLTKGSITTLDDRMLRSEITFGSFVVGYKMRVGGEPYTELYRLRERALDPVWLAIEPTYEEVLQEHVSDINAPGTPEQRRHRRDVIQARKALHRSKRKALFAFESRKKILPEALRIILSQRGFSASNFEVENKPIKDIGKLWERLGWTIQHHLLLRYIDGDQSVAHSLMTY